MTLHDLRGSVVVVTFLFTKCPDACPTLTRKLIEIQRGLPRSARLPVRFLAVSVDPRNDTPSVLAEYARAVGADLRSWAFLSGPAARIAEVGRGYGIAWQGNAGGGVDHTFLTSIVDPNGRMRVQYMGSRFDPKEFRADLVTLLREGRVP